jgi:DNA-binding response OmpR family regulator
VIRILVVEDEPMIAEGLKDDLELEGYAVDVVADGVSAEARARDGAYDLIPLDIMLPRRDGFEVCRALRTHGIATGIILLTAKGQEVDKVRGLEIGADDYVTKPFSPRELLARVRAVLRRAGDENGAAEQTWQHGDLRIDFRRFEARRGATRLALTPTEFKILKALYERRGEVVSIDDLLHRVWGRDIFLTDRVVYTHVNNLRAKVEHDPSHPRIVVGVRGLGSSDNDSRSANRLSR